MKPISQAIANFFKTTTLHGFKYLISDYYCDRVGWLLGCVASACCAGVLCVVLWDRFLDIPALLQLRDLSIDDTIQPIPSVAFCQPIDAVAESFLKHVKTNGENTTRIPGTLANAIGGKNTDSAQLDLIENLLKLNQLSLVDMLHLYTPDCSQIISKCRWRDVFVECERLFKRQLTRFGVCCVATPNRLSKTFVPVIQRLDIMKKLDVALQCVEDMKGVEFYANYIGEEWIEPTRLVPGYTNFAHLTFIVEKEDHDDEKLIEGICNNSKEYSKFLCQIKCTETICGCSDPLMKIIRKKNEAVPRPCPLTRISCVRTYLLKENVSCHCLPACQEVMTTLVTEQAPYKSVEASLDPFYSDLNTTHSVVLRLRINIKGSKLFLAKPTETWLTLLSSLGGVFNMFLGVGLFSALEFLFLIFVKIPISVRQSTETSLTTKVRFDHVHKLYI